MDVFSYKVSHFLLFVLPFSFLKNNIWAFTFRMKSKRMTSVNIFFKIPFLISSFDKFGLLAYIRNDHMI
jgi:hypothetical protein